MRCFSFWLTAAVVILSFQPAGGQPPEGTVSASNFAVVQTFAGQTADDRIETAARRYRIVIYNAFHANRVQYDLHRAALDKAVDAWRAAGGSEEHLGRLLAWLEQSTRSLASRPAAPLPTIPNFAAEITQPAAPATAKSPLPVDKKPPVKQREVMKPILPEVKEPKQEETKQPLLPEKPATPETPIVTEKPVEPETPTATEKGVQSEKPVAPLAPVLPAPPTPPTEPAMPAQPAQPAVPSKPSQPEKPPLPEKPVTTEKPIISEKPIEPLTPTTPEKPVAAAAKVAPPALPRANESAKTTSVPAPVLPKLPAEIKPDTASIPQSRSAVPPSVPATRKPIAATPAMPTTPQPTTPQPTRSQPAAPQKPSSAERYVVELPTLPKDDALMKTPSPARPARSPSSIAKPNPYTPPRRTTPIAKATPLPKTTQLPKTPPVQKTTPLATKPPVARIAARPQSVPRSSRDNANLPGSTPSRQPVAVASKPSLTDIASTPKAIPAAGTEQTPPLPSLSSRDLANGRKTMPLGAEGAASGEDADSEVNLIELAAQIAGTNMALRGVEAQLEKTRFWDAVQLEQMVDILKKLSTRHDDLTLFRDLLPESDRRLVGQLDSTRAAISECSNRLSECKSRAASRSFRGNEEDRAKELQKLDELAQELARLTPTP